MDLVDYQTKLLKRLDEEIKSLTDDIVEGVPGTEMQYRKLVERRRAFVDTRDIAKELFGRVDED